ncbi:hypothetical protein Tco_0002909 [Tanacetum coccineum]
MEAIRFTNTSVDEIRMDDSSRYPLNEYLYEDDPFRQYKTNSNTSYYITPHNCSLTELTKTNHVPEVIVPNEQNTHHIEEIVGDSDLINTEGTNDQYVQNEQIDKQITKIHSGDNTETSVLTIELSVPEMTQSSITHHASTSLNHVPQDRWLRDQHIKLINIIGEPTKGMLTRSMTAKLIVASTSECIFANFLFKIEPKKVLRALKHQWWVVAIQEELHQFHRNTAWTLVPLPRGKSFSGSK